MLELTNRAKAATCRTVTWLSWLSYRFTANPAEAGPIFSVHIKSPHQPSPPINPEVLALTKSVLTKHAIKKSLIYQKYLQYIN